MRPADPGPGGAHDLRGQLPRTSPTPRADERLRAGAGTCGCFRQLRLPGGEGTTGGGAARRVPRPRIFKVAFRINATISTLKIANGRTPNIVMNADGGAISNWGMLTITNATIFGSFGRCRAGGGDRERAEVVEIVFTSLGLSACGFLFQNHSLPEL